MKPTKIYSDTIEQGVLDQFNAAMALPCVVQGALMPDSHQGYSLPIGAVVKTKDEIFPAFVGYDIGCGVACLEVNLNYKEIDLESLKTNILNSVPIGFNSHSTPQDTSNLPEMETSTTQMLKDVFSIKGNNQLGTLGGGNHFIEVGYLESNENIAIVIHSGSRGFGHGVASHYMQEAASQSAASGWSVKLQELADDFNKRNEQWCNSCKNTADVERYEIAFNKYITKQKAQYMKKQDIEGLHSFNINSQLGKDYLADMNFCLEYALLNRKMMISQIFDGILAQGVSAHCTEESLLGKFINRNHNHAELVDGHIIHRKGATHAEKGMMGVIPGNMRDGSFIVKGKGNPDSMSSSSHGAGRVLSRKKAKATLSLEEFQAETAKLVTNHTEAMLDEAPKAYKDIFEVMELQSDLVKVVDRVVPILNIKG